MNGEGLRLVTIQHTIGSAQGLHARPVALICRCALDHLSDIELACRGRKADARDMIALMGMNAAAGEVLDVTISGPDEEQTATALQKILKESL